MTELKPCFRCNGEAKRIPRFCMGYAGDGIRCDCGVETPKHLTDDKAIKWWNTRATTKAERQIEAIREVVERYRGLSHVAYEIEKILEGGK